MERKETQWEVLGTEWKRKQPNETRKNEIKVMDGAKRNGIKEKVMKSKKEGTQRNEGVVLPQQ